jgi:hypothetical protein
MTMILLFLKLTTATEKEYYPLREGYVSLISDS